MGCVRKSRGEVRHRRGGGQTRTCTQTLGGWHTYLEAQQSEMDREGGRAGGRAGVHEGGRTCVTYPLE